MKCVMCVIVAVALSAGFSPAHAAAPESMVGTWKVESVTISGKECTTGVGMLATGAIWKVKKGGKATVGGFDDWTWTYDSDDGEFVMKRKFFFGLGEETFTSSVTKDGAKIRIGFQALLSPWEIVLKKD
jgi:hypothetical protein